MLKEVEFSLTKEKGPFLENFKEKLENDAFEDIAAIYTDNLNFYPEFREGSINTQNLYHSESFVNILQNSKILQNYSKILIDSDINRFFKSSGFISSFYNIPRVFGPNIEKRINFIKAWTSRYFNKEPKAVFRNLLVLGGDFELTKIKFLLFS